MAQKYMLVPLASGIFSTLDLVERAALGALYDRTRLSGYNHIGDPSGNSWYDYDMQQVYCVYSQTELANLLGVSERTVRRALTVLRDKGFIWWRKATYKGACRYFLDQRIRDELQNQ